MKIFADLHLHSHYSRATSNEMNIENLEKNAKIKGLNLLGTGDFTHPLWLKELKRNLTEAENKGLFHFKDKDIYFMLQAEVSNIYEQDGKTRKIHNIILSPSFEIVDQINDFLKNYGNLASDGRPILTNINCIELAENLINISKEIMIIPAHAWTPWFGILGSKSGFDSIEECFQEQTKNIFALETGLSCYDKETEVLTDGGWKKFSDVKYSDKICTLDAKSNNIEFQMPMKIHRYQYKGKMYRLKTKRVDLLVTPNHKILYSPCDFRRPPKFILKEAELLFNKSKRFKKNGFWKGKEIDYFILPSVKIKHGSRYYSGLRNKKEKRLPIIPWLKFFGFWIAEGWTTEGKNGDYNVCLSNKNHALISEMKKILENLGYDVYWSERNYTLRIRDYQLFHYLKQFGKCYNKFIPPEIKSLSKELLEIFLEYYIKGDGHVYGRNRKGLSATTSSIRLRDDLQEIALKIGISAYYKLHRKKGTPILSLAYKYKKIYKQKEDTWVIYFIRKNLHTVLPSTIKKYKYVESWIDFEGPVFCVTVPNHVIYIRRNGIPIWCGNSDPPMNWRLSALDRFVLVSNSDSHSPWPTRLGRELNVFDTEMNYKEIIDAIKEKDTKKFLYTIEVDPAYGKYHWDGHRNCNVSLDPKESKKYHDICPVCGKPLTIGVLHRVEELADRPEGFVPKNAVSFRSLLPLSELLAAVYNTQIFSKKVWEESMKLTREFGSELNVLLETPEEKLRLITHERIAEIIVKNRKGELKVQPGYDGIYGRLLLNKSTSIKQPQKRLDSFTNNK
jgi:PHP family Zn ribbon phosphoesterase